MEAGPRDTPDNQEDEVRVDFVAAAVDGIEAVDRRLRADPTARIHRKARNLSCVSTLDRSRSLSQPNTIRTPILAHTQQPVGRHKPRSGCSQWALSHSALLGTRCGGIAVEGGRVKAMRATGGLAGWALRTGPVRI